MPFWGQCWAARIKSLDCVLYSVKGETLKLMTSNATEMYTSCCQPSDKYGFVQYWVSTHKQE